MGLLGVQVAYTQTLGAVQTSPAVSAQSQTIVTSTQLNQAHWPQLNEDDWQHYDSIMRGIGRFRYAHLTPPQVLGTMATTDQQRQRYAEIVAIELDAHFQNVGRFAEFVDDAKDRLNLSFNVFDPARIQQKFEEYSLKQIMSGRKKPSAVLYTVVTDLDCASCNQSILAMLDDEYKKLDVFFINADNDQAIQQWAANQQIDIQDIYTQRITLNHALPQHYDLAQANTLPVIVESAPKQPRS